MDKNWLVHRDLVCCFVTLREVVVHFTRATALRNGSEESWLGGASECLSRSSE